jgi:type I restriction enzyme R subunit
MLRTMKGNPSNYKYPIHSSTTAQMVAEQHKTFGETKNKEKR